VAWMLRLVKTGAEGEGPCADIMEIRRPDDLVDIANLGLTLADCGFQCIPPTHTDFKSPIVLI